MVSVALYNRNPEKYISIKRSLMYEDIKLGKCKWCGEVFVRRYAPEKYCSDICRSKSRAEQSRRKSINWYHRNKYRLSENQRFGLGSGRLGSHSRNDFKVEAKIIKNELYRLKLR